MYQIVSGSVPAKNFKRYFTNLQNVVMYPISNTSVNTKVEIYSCKYYSSPIAPSITGRLGNPINSTAGGFSVMTTS